MPATGVAVFWLALATQLLADEAAVRSTLIAANRVWVEASRTLDPEPLAEVFAEEALRSLEDLMRLGRGAGMWVDYEEPRLEIEWLTMAPDGQTARAWVAETWSSTGHRMDTGRCIWRVRAHETRQHYTLRLREGAWRIVKLEDDPANAPPRRLPCEQAGR